MSLFRDAVGEVKPVQNDRVHATPPRPAVPRLRQREADERSVMESLLSELSENDFLETGEHLAWTRPGVQRSVLRKLKSGKYSVQGELDLHGLIVEEARTELSGFLSAARIERRQRSKHVLAFCSARTSDGGTGAVYVLLRRPEE